MSKQMIALIASVMLSFLTVTAAFGAEAAPAKVVGVSDGDTITVVIKGEQVKIRFYGIDAPEKAQPYGQVATDAMKQLTTGRSITVQAIERDRYGRTVAMVYADGVNLNEAMVQNGNAWVYQQYCTQPFCADWKNSEAAAHSAQKGLWQDSNPTPPWEWRHGGNSGKQEVVKTKPDAAGTFSGNVNSKKFHSSGCRYANCKNCTATFTSREQAIAAGYSPCKICNP